MIPKMPYISTDLLNITSNLFYKLFYILGSTTSDLESLLDKKIILDEYEAFSFDIFDTLIERKNFRPEDWQRRIVDLWAECLSNLGYAVSADDLFIARARVEKELRERNLKEGGDGEVNIRDLIDTLVNTICDRNHEGVFKSLLDIELSLELTALTVKPGVLNFVNILTRKGKRLFAISDMYLDINSIRFILNSLGFVGVFENVYVSSDSGMLKSTGRLFEKYLIENSLTADRCVHIGDNIFSDIKGARASGISPILVKRSIVKSLTKDSLYKLALEDLYDLYLSNVPCRNESFINDYLAVNIYFPCFFYIEKLASEAIKLNKSVLFVAREGIVLQWIFNNYCRLKGLSISSDVIFLSRGVFDIDQIVSESQAYAKEILNAHKDCSLPELKQIHDLNLKKYLEQYDFNNALLADVGWGGTIEKSINSILNIPLSARYFGVDKRYYNPHGDGVVFAKTDHALIPSVYRGFGAFEAILTPASYGTTLTYLEDCKSKRIVPVLSKPCDIPAFPVTDLDFSNIVNAYIHFRRSTVYTDFDVKIISQKLFLSFATTPPLEFTKLVSDFDTGGSRKLVSKVRFNRSFLSDLVRSIWLEGSLVNSGYGFMLPIVRLGSFLDSDITRKLVKRLIR